MSTGHAPAHAADTSSALHDPSTSSQAGAGGGRFGWVLAVVAFAVADPQSPGSMAAMAPSVPPSRADHAEILR